MCAAEIVVAAAKEVARLQLESSASRAMVYQLLPPTPLVGGLGVGAPNERIDAVLGVTTMLPEVPVSAPEVAVIVTEPERPTATPATILTLLSARTKDEAGSVLLPQAGVVEAEREMPP